MSTIELPSYVPTIPLPAPVTSGSGIQSYTDPYGDVWVAANGVNSGVWRRAREVLKSRVYRSAAVNFPTTATALTFDGVSRDDYGCWSGANYTAPVAGWYRCHSQMQGSSPAVGGYIQLTLQSAGSSFAQDTLYFYATSVYGTVRVVDLIPMAAGQQAQVMIRASAVVGSIVGNSTDIATFEYLGAG